MNINYHATGKQRKALVNAIGSVMGLEDEIKYLGAPTYAYRIGESIVVDREGNVMLPDLPEDLITQLKADLKALGFEESPQDPTVQLMADLDALGLERAPEAETSEEVEANEENEASEADTDAEKAPEADSAITENAPAEADSDNDRITVSIPNNLSGDEEERLFAIVDSKRSLLKKALETNDLPIKVDKDVIQFPWFKNHDIEGEAVAYSQLITAIVKMAKEQKRVVAKDKQEENEKFAMRIFTVRLGLKGDEYKLIRKLLSRNLSGNSSWKHGKPDKPASTAQKGADFNATIAIPAEPDNPEPETVATNTAEVVKEAEEDSSGDTKEETNE